MTSNASAAPQRRQPPPAAPNKAGVAITVFGLVLGLSFVVGSVKQLVKLRHEREELARTEALRREVFKERSRLRRRVAALKDPKVLENEAREKLGLVKKNEIPIQIVKGEDPSGKPLEVPEDKPPPNANKKQAKPEKKPGFWKRVLEFFE